MASNQALDNSCTCEWAGDAHYPQLVKKDMKCSYHKWDTPYIPILHIKVCPYCKGTGKLMM